MVCPLCLEECRVPVEITCFPCYRPDAVHCHSLVRYCKACCIRLFELEKAPQDRRASLKCLYCDRWMNPREISCSPFRVDHLLILKDDAATDLECPYCEYRAVSHQDLEKHCAKACEKSPRLACLCGSYHSPSNPGDRCTTCSLCDRSLPLQSFRRHMLETHEMTYCTECKKFTRQTLTMHKKEECVFRGVSCKRCHENILALHYPEHLLSHVSESKKRCELMQDVIDKEKQMVQHILKECRDFFGDMYDEE